MLIWVVIVGKSAHYTDVNNPDWIPTKNLGYVESTYEKLDDDSNEEVDDDNIKSDNSPWKASKETQTLISNNSIGVQTDDDIMNGMLN